MTARSLAHYYIVKFSFLGPQFSGLGADSLVVAKLDGLRFFLLLIHFLGNFPGRRGLQV